MGSVALYGAQSGAGRAGGGGRILDVVQCRRPLRFRFRSGVAGSATVAVPLAYGNLAPLPEGQGRCVRTRRDPSFDAHRTPARDCRIRPCAGTIDATAPGPAEACSKIDLKGSLRRARLALGEIPSSPRKDQEA